LLAFALVANRHVKLAEEVETVAVPHDPLEAETIHETFCQRINHTWLQQGNACIHSYSLSRVEVRSVAQLEHTESSVNSPANARRTLSEHISHIIHHGFNNELVASLLPSTTPLAAVIESHAATLMRFAGGATQRAGGKEGVFKR
jgi:hypothetical protein